MNTLQQLSLPLFALACLPAALHAHDMQIEVAPTGLQILAGEQELTLSLESWGRPGCMQPVPAPTSHVIEGQRSDTHRGPLTEWYVREPQRVEQGFDVLEAPAGDGPLMLSLAVGGDLLARVQPGRRDAQFIDAAGQVVLHYTGLVAWDAAGRDLETWLVADGQRLSILVDDDGARYPLTIDPLIWREIKALSAAESGVFSFFGKSVAIEGDVAVVGAPGAPNGSVLGAGSVSVFERTAGVWQRTAELFASNPVKNDWFGNEVAISGDTIVVGAPNEDFQFVDSGAIYVFVRSGTSWVEQAMLTQSDPSFDQLFGSNIDIEGDTIAVGTPRPLTGTGSVYVFTRTGTTWVESIKLLAADGESGDQFGRSVSLAGGTLAVGTPWDRMPFGNAPGAVYVFTGSGASWAQQAWLLASDWSNGDQFGTSVSLSGESLAVGAPVDNQLGFLVVGSAYVFVRTGSSWAEEAKLVASDFAAYAILGHTIALEGDTLLAGAYGDDENGIDAGAGYVFERSGTTWTEVAKLAGSDTGAGDAFGVSVAASGDSLLLGGPYHAGFDGSAYLFGKLPAPALSYCTAGTSAAGCQATLTALGGASISKPNGFILLANVLEGGKNGILFFGTSGRQANPWGSGTSYQCVAPPVKRLGLLSGVGTPGVCDGGFSLDLNALWCPTCPKAHQNPGYATTVQAQLWYRDPQNTSNQTTGLSDAIEFCVGP